MGINAPYEVKIVRQIDKSFRVEWITLFCECFKKSKLAGLSAFKKYEINTSLFAAVYVEGKIAACYSGIFTTSVNTDLNLFLSTDTMSNGIIKGGSIIGAKALYRILSQRNIDVVCGFPNHRIYGLRKQKLGWQFGKFLYVHVKIPFSVPNKRQISFRQPTFVIKRPSAEFFRPINLPITFFDVSHKGYRLSIMLSSEKHIDGFINFGAFYKRGRKSFCFKILDNSKKLEILKKIDRLVLSSHSIDVP